MRTKLCIYGSRNVKPSFEWIDEVVVAWFGDDADIELVCGMADGADMAGLMWADRRGYPVTKFPAEWKKYGKAAGPLRNKQMAEYCSAALGFWDGVSPGTANMTAWCEVNGVAVTLLLVR